MGNNKQARVERRAAERKAARIKKEQELARQREKQRLLDGLENIPKADKKNLGKPKK